MNQGAVVLGLTTLTGQRVTTYMPGVILAVQVNPPAPMYAGDALAGQFQSWRVNILTEAGWEQVGAWATNVDDAEDRARELARRIINMATDDEPVDPQYLVPIEVS